MKAIAFYNAYITRIVATLGGIIALSVFLYGAFLLMAVAHAAGISQAQEKARTLTGTLSTLEATYLAQTKSLTQETAVTLGFVKPSHVAVVYATVPSALTVNR